MNDPQLPDDDRDLRLARALGENVREGNRRSADVDEQPAGEQIAFLEFLRAGRERLVTGEATPTDTMWSAIARKTNPRARIYRLTPWASFAAAAAVVILISVLVLRLSSLRVETIATASGSIEHITTDDGSRVALRPNSSLRLDHRSGVFLLDGEAHFDVTHRDDNQFVVRTSDVDIAVLGTRFVVTQRGGATTVFLEDGRVQLRARSSDEEAVLEPGEARSISSGAISEVRNDEAAEALDWMSGQLAFDSRPVSDVIDELAFHFGLDVRIPDSLSTELISGRILLDSADESLADLGVILGGTFERGDDGSIVFVASAR